MTATGFVLTLPGPTEVVQDPESGEWTASNDAVRVAAAGQTRDEAIKHFHVALWEQMNQHMLDSWKAIPRNAR